MNEMVEKSAMRKIYIRLLPFAILSYFLAYIDRINVSFAALTMRGARGAQGWRCATCHPPAGARPGEVAEMRT
jgi:hypothetical protein